MLNTVVVIIYGIINSYVTTNMNRIALYIYISNAKVSVSFYVCHLRNGRMYLDEIICTYTFINNLYKVRDFDQYVGYFYRGRTHAGGAAGGC